MIYFKTYICILCIPFNPFLCPHLIYIATKMLHQCNNIHLHIDISHYLCLVFLIFWLFSLNISIKMSVHEALWISNTQQITHNISNNNNNVKRKKNFHLWVDFEFLVCAHRRMCVHDYVTRFFFRLISCVKLWTTNKLYRIMNTHQFFFF